jgi:hypothetical protein
VTVVVNGRHSQRYGDERPVLPWSNRLEMGDRPARPDVRQDHVFFGLATGRNDHPNRVTAGFRGGEAKHAFGRLIHEVMTPFKSLLMMASSDDPTTRARWRV